MNKSLKQIKIIYIFNKPNTETEIGNILFTTLILNDPKIHTNKLTRVYYVSVSVSLLLARSLFCFLKQGITL